ncbi:MAG: response regulator, partial [Candidatus Eisenbacteria bacterium]
MPKILIVEDEATVRANLAELLDAEGYQVVQAVDGLEGLRVARGEHPDLVLCDIMMPNLDGRGLLEAIRQDAELAATPFVFLTAKADRRDVRAGMNQGADDYLVKPFTRAEVLSTLEARLRREQTTEARVQAGVRKLGTTIAQSLPHELRTPLNGILAGSQLLMEFDETGCPEDVRELAACVFNSARRLEELVMSFLLLTELDLATLDPAQAARVLVTERHSVRDRVRHALVGLDSEMNRPGDLEVDVEEAELPLNPLHFDRVIRELVRNAFKFSPLATPVCVRGRLEVDSYRLSVEDQGRGLSPEELAEVGPFVQI